jgi:hypothetical protein
VQVDQWRQLIAAAAARRPSPVKAHTYRNKKWGTASAPVVLGCDDGSDYVVKGQQVGRAIANEQIVGKLGAALGAPVGQINLIDVPADLIGMQAELRHMTAGVSHGSLLVPDCSDKLWLAHHDVAENRSRFAALAVLYGWIPAGDHQLIDRQTAPHLVYSVDHGHFFPGGPNWTVAGLAGAGPARPYGDLVNGCGITRDELRPVMDQLQTVTAETIAEAVAAPPNVWSITAEERVTVAAYLQARREQLLAALAA